MSNKPLVSGIIIFLNAEKFIQEAIESVFAQTYDHWELMLVDDGSTDGSTEIAQRYAKQYPGKVRYLEHDGHQNYGMSASRNLGIRNAKGEYIAFLDADDVWLPPKLEKQVAILGSQPEAAIVYGPSQMWYSWTGKPEDIKRDYIRGVGVQLNTLIEPPTLLILYLRTEAVSPATCGVLVRRQVFKDIGGFENIFRGMYEDHAFFTKVFLKAPVFVDSGCWDKYRQHSDNCCLVAQKIGQYNPGNPHPAQVTFLNWLAAYLTQQGVKDTKIWKALQKSLLPYRHPILYRLLRLVNLIGQRIMPVPVHRWLRAQYITNFVR